MSPDRSSPLHLAWARVRDSLWFVPSVAVVIATVLAILAVQIPTPDSTSELARLWLFGGGAAGARSMLSAIAGSLITVTGVVFSVTIVALQLASSQFTPRVLGSFVADRVNQAVLGVFIGTFTYTLLVLRTIRSAADDRALFVPHVAVTIALMLLLVSIAALIIYINHSARSIQASVILHRETLRTLARVDVLFPERVGHTARDMSDDAQGDALPAGAPGMVTASHSGYLQVLHTDTLWKLEEAHGTRLITIRMESPIGAFVFPGKRLATVWPADAVDEPFERAVRAAFALGPERTIEQDVEFGLIVIVDIALRALSPGINDPTTAMQCIDRLTEILAALGTREPPPTLRRSPDGTMRLLMRSITFPGAVALAFDQIRLFGAENPAIANRLLQSLIELASVVPASLHGTLHAQAQAVMQQSRRSIRDADALQTIERLAVIVLEPHVVRAT